MRTMQKFEVRALVLALVVGLSGCAGMSTQERNTAIGAGVGGVGAAALGAGALGTLGGAAVGGVIGHEWERITD